MNNDLTFLDGPVDVTHDHYKKQDQMVLRLKELYGYQNKIRESSQLYKKKKISNTNQMNHNYLNEEMQKIEHDKKLKEVIEKQLQEEVDIELDVLLNRDIKDRNVELMQKKIDFINSLEEYNKIIQYQMVKQLLEVKEIQEKFNIDFNQKLQEIKDYVSTIDDYNMMHVKFDDLNKKASKSLTNYRKKELSNEKEKINNIQKEFLSKIIANIDLILNSENVLSSPVKQLLLYKLNEMLFFLDEIMRSKKNYQTFVLHCYKTQNINLSNIDIFSNNENSDEEDSEETTNIGLVINSNERRAQFSNNKINNDGMNIEFTYQPEQNQQKEGINQEQKNNKVSITTDLEERIQKIQLRYQKHQLKKEKKKSLSQPPSFSKEIIELELQNLVRFQNKLNLVEKILSNPKMMKYEEVQRIMQTLWEYQDILAIQISCAKNKLEKYLIALNNKNFVAQEIVRTINKQIKLLKSIPDQEQAKSYIENQKRNNTFKRYTNDQGKITNYHFVLNANNLKPLLQKLDPSSFLDDEKKHQKQMQNKLKRIKEKAEKKYMKSKMNQTTTQFNTATDFQSGRVSPENSYRQSDSGQTRERCVSQASAYSFLQKQPNIQKPQIQQEKQLQTSSQQNELSIFYLNDYLENGQPKRNWTTSQANRIKKASLTGTPIKMIKGKMNISKYVNDSFDQTGYNNVICDKQREIDISANVHYVMLSNIFSNNNEVIEIEDFIEKEKAKKEEEIPEKQSLNPKQLYNDRYSRFKFQSNSSTRPTTGKTTLRHKNELNNSNAFDQSSHQQSQLDESTSKFQRVRSNNLSVSFYKNDKNNQSNSTSRPNSAYQQFNVKQKRSSSQVTSLTPNNSSTQQCASLQQKGSGSNIYQLREITPIREQFSKDLVNNDSFQSSFYRQEHSNQKSQSIKAETKQSQQNLQDEGQEEQQEEIQIYLDNKEQKEAEKLRRRKNLMLEILERKRPRYIFLGSSRNPIKGTPEQIQEIQKNALLVQQRTKQQAQEKDRVKLQKRIQSMEKQWEVSNIETLEGPPKKYYVETSTIQHDFKDKVISKIINH